MQSHAKGTISAKLFGKQATESTIGNSNNIHVTCNELNGNKRFPKKNECFFFKKEIISKTEKIMIHKIFLKIMCYLKKETDPPHLEMCR